MNRSPAVTAALISAIAVVGASLIAGIFSLLNRHDAADLQSNIVPSEVVVSYRADFWELSHTITLAALGRAEGAPEGSVRQLFQIAQIISHDLGVPLPELPDRTSDEAKNRAKAIDYVLNDIGNILTERAQRSYSETEAALVALAAKSMLAALLYSPEEDNYNFRESLYAGIESAAVRSGVPSHLYEPLLDSIRERLSYETVKQRIISMHENVDSYLRLNQPLQPTAGSGG